MTAEMGRQWQSGPRAGILEREGLATSFAVHMQLGATASTATRRALAALPPPSAFALALTLTDSRGGPRSATALADARGGAYRGLVYRPPPPDDPARHAANACECAAVDARQP